MILTSFLLALATLQPTASGAPARPDTASGTGEAAMTMGQQHPGDGLASSAMNEDPPSEAKLELIRRYLRLTGTQRKIDSGSFLQRYAFPGGPLTQAMTARGGQVSLRDMFEIPMAALRRAYEPRRHIWQAEYERHVNWEYTEEELRQIVAFLESGAGRHFLEGEWRMNAYMGTNTEDLEEQIVREAEASLRAETPRDSE